MKTTAEMKIEISNARISNATIMPDGTCKLELELEMATQKQNNNEIVNDECILVEASKLSLNDDFMLFTPETDEQKWLKDTLTKIIKNGIEDFYRPTMDPSFMNKSCTKIHYKAGELPATGRSYNWWERTVKHSKWSIGTRSQYIAFLGVLIKNLVAKGWSCCEAWYAVCNDSKALGHYRNSDNANEYTGSSEICGFFDLANTYKILAKDREIDGFWVAGDYRYNGSPQPIAFLLLTKNYNLVRDDCVAWLVLKKESCSLEI